MGKLDTYRRAALACLQLAEATSDPKSRLVLVQMAQTWADLANQAVKNTQTDLVCEAPSIVPW